MFCRCIRILTKAIFSPLCRMKYVLYTFFILCIKFISIIFFKKCKKILLFIGTFIRNYLSLQVQKESLGNPVN